MTSEVYGTTFWQKFKFDFILQSTCFTHERTTSNIHKIFHSPIWFFNYEMILRTFNCTIVNQIKSSKKLVVKLKIRNLQLLQMKTIFKLFFGRVPLFSTSHWICLVVFSNASWPSFDADGGFNETDFLLELWVEISQESFFSKVLCTWIDKLNT